MDQQILHYLYGQRKMQGHNTQEAQRLAEHDFIAEKEAEPAE